jgi:hypothetical protein
LSANVHEYKMRMPIKVEVVDYMHDFGLQYINSWCVKKNSWCYVLCTDGSRNHINELYLFQIV